MSKEKIIVLISLALGVVLFLRLCIFGYSGKRRFIQRAYQRGDYTKAYIVQTSRYSGTHTMKSAYMFPSYKAKYEYNVGGKTYYKSYHFNARSGFSSGPPHSITVYYSRNNPAKAVSGTEVKNGPRASGCYLTILIVIAVAILLFNVWKLF